jgi:molybdate transport system substrate-binding protein
LNPAGRRRPSGLGPLAILLLIAVSVLGGVWYRSAIMKPRNRQRGAGRRGVPAAEILIAAALFWAAALPAARAGEVKIAVAANFTEAALEIGRLFQKADGVKVLFSFGSTGQLYAQITQGAPYEVFLAADRIRPQKAVAAGFAVAGSRFTYATGKIVLYSADETRILGKETLIEGDFHKLAIANPLTAPYGAAAVAALRALGVYDALSGKIVRGANIAQAYQFVRTGNAEVGIVALAQVIRSGEGSRWPIPGNLYSTIAQDAVLLRRGADNPAAAAFLTFLRGDAAAAVKRKYGYGAGE